MVSREERPEVSPALTNVAAYLPLLAKQRPDALAVAVASRRGGYDTLTAAELNAQSDRAAWALRGIGITEGTRTVLMVKPSPAFFVITFALLKLGAIPVMIDPGMGIRNLGPCLAEAEPTAFIGIGKAHIARILFGWARGTLETVVTVGPRLWGGHRFESLMATADSTPFTPVEPDPEQTAAILFTSGSTGRSKGVITPHRVFLAQVQALRDSFGIEPGERDLATFPLFALFGPALGMASIVPDMDASKPAQADPARLLQAFRDFECTNLFASPAVIDRLGRHCEAQRITLTGLNRAISAGAPASSPSIARLQAWMPPGAYVWTPYGATEALPLTTFSSQTLLSETRAQTEIGAGNCVGHPVPGVEMRIIAIHDDPIEAWSEDLALPPGAMGEIVVQGAMVTPAYYGRPRETALAKIKDPSGVLWHRMGDVGYLDEQGRLWMCGRKAHRVVNGDTTWFSLPVEAVFNTHPAVRRTALVGLGTPGKATPVLCVERAPDASMSMEALIPELRTIAAAFAHTQAIERFLEHPKFPVDVRHNSKIFREQLAQWAAKQ